VTNIHQPLWGRSAAILLVLAVAVGASRCASRPRPAADLPVPRPAAPALTLRVEVEDQIGKGHRIQTIPLEDYVRGSVPAEMPLGEPDGLVADLAKLCRASGVGARVDSPRVPVASALHESFADEESLLCALGGGEDYEVLFTGPRQAVERAVASIDGAAVIGEIVADTPGRVIVLGAEGNELEVSDAGWEHLST